MESEWIYRHEVKNIMFFCGENPYDSFVSFVNFLHFFIFIRQLTRMKPSSNSNGIAASIFSSNLALLYVYIRLRPQSIQCTAYKKWEWMTLNIACAKGTIFEFFIILLSYVSAYLVLTGHTKNSRMYIDLAMPFLLRQALKMSVNVWEKFACIHKSMETSWRKE